MGARVTAEEVKEIIDTTLSDSSIEAYINAANLTVTRLLGSSVLEDEELKEVERWLTAHFIACTRERQPRAEQVGEAGITYQGYTGIGLDATLYGQQVKVLDTTGTLSSQLGKRNVSVYAVTSFDTSGIG